jgi:hypothetical protein
MKGECVGVMEGVNNSEIYSSCCLFYVGCEEGLEGGNRKVGRSMCVGVIGYRAVRGEG